MWATMAKISLATLLSRVSLFSPVNAAAKVLQEHPNVIPSLIRGQLYQGLNGYDSPLRPAYRSLAYAEEKYEQNSAAGFRNPDVLVTGAFYRGIETNVSGAIVTTTSRDSKNDKLTEKYGDSIHKLGTDAKVELIVDTLKPGMIDEFIATTKTASTF